MTALPIDAFQPVLDALTDSAVLLDTHGTVVAVNRHWKEFADNNGASDPNYWRGANYVALCRNAVGPGSAGASTVAEGLSRVISEGEAFHHEYPCDSPEERRWFELTASRLEAQGKVFILICHRNITTRRLQRDELLSAQTRADELAALVATTPDAVMSFDLEGGVRSWNKAAEQLYGYSADEIVGRSIEALYPPEQTADVVSERDRILAGQLEHVETQRQTRDGRILDVAVSGAPVRSAAGDVVAISNFHRDISQRKRADEHLQMITGELTHRTKNILAIVSAIERQTSQSTATKEEFHERFAARIKSLMASHDLLVAQSWQHVSMRDLLLSQLAAFADERLRSISMKGPAILLKPEAAQTIGLSMHELATNAMKYGGLSRPEGGVALCWLLDQANCLPILELRWREYGVPLLTPPTHKGFGHRVITELTRSALDAEVNLAYAQEGLKWSVRIPQKHFHVAAA